jgi:hypothetical protein
MKRKTETNLIMKNKLQLRTAAALLIILASMAVVSAQPPPKSAPEVNPATGLPVTPPAPAEPQWISSDWKDPDIVLTNVSLDHIPISEVARYLRETFKDYFDVLLPDSGNPGVQTIVVLQLKHVKASEVCNAMNMLFQNDRTPLRWELKMNYSRPTVQLRVLLDSPPESKRMTFFVGDLIGDEKSGGMTMKQIVQIISDVWAEAYNEPGVVQFYEPAQLIIVTGTQEQIDFVDRTIAALQRKVEMMRREQLKSSGTKAKTEAPTASDAAAPK